jgi:hypothetical protein
MFTRRLFYVGFVFLLLTLVGLLALTTRSSPREAMTSGVNWEELIVPTLTPVAPRATAVPTPRFSPVPPTPGTTLTSLLELVTSALLLVMLVILFTWLGKRWWGMKNALAKWGCVLLPGLLILFILLMVSLGALPRLAPAPTSTPAATQTPAARTPTPAATQTPAARTPTPAATKTLVAPTPTPAPTVVIEAEWPRKMEVDRSDSIRIALVRTAGQPYVPTIEVPGHTPVVASPIPVGTPGIPLASAFGPDYEVSAIANLMGTAFEVERAAADWQSLEPPRVTWEWNVISKNPGPQVLNATIEVQWKPKISGQTISRQIWRSRLEIAVEKPLIATGQLEILTVLSGVLGSGFSLPWLYERLKERLKKKSTIPKKRLGKIRILAIFANPKGTDPLRLGTEDRVIHECIRLSKYRDKISLEVIQAATIHDVRRALLDQDYRIVHFSGHGTGKGLAFENEVGEVQLVPPEALAEFLSAYSPPIECVILNACYSDVHGQLASLDVPYTIGMNGAISDEGATEFTRGFYEAVGAGKSIEFAYEEGCRTIKLMGLPDGLVPVLFKKTEDKPPKESC